ncbi:MULTISPECIES: DHH family phosphoesterase [Desulfococcus]|uniref:Phosphoesterase RecJ domain protein n=1 Tax=Desulfococcus multivorans DSM 2059 TaxID=1121405 RepID=S7TZI3_DESML|nr:bifunctional oligoribonuclease/PAP phosphatase NrnA [Desulfococcus multivorans]AOY58259.1 phosphoesterase RecJ domain protein [Desulfococcus multivorans]AQV00603.1 exopolyphosphatase-like protein [Desulfococcus multivorans]EPR42487.1 phosphoesterase RecJ domain protein [Desulfococcus multivorans DSM 2059]SJZ97644.1 DHH family protein [Desulfococcus multivorans DSM 2059]
MTDQEAEQSRPNANDPTSKLIETLEKHRGERHVIVLQDYPDPDAISAALAHQICCSRFEIETDIIHSGRISHQQNIALVRLLGIDLIRYEPNLDLTPYSGAVFLDTQGSTATALVKALAEAKIPTIIVVDHHETQAELNVEFKDIRRNIGSTASIYSEYLKNGLLTLDGTVQEHIKIATALTHGIITDTGGFVYAKPEDFQAAAFLSRYKDADLLNQIMMQERSRQTMDITERALRNRELAENFSISGIGYLRAEDRDAIPQAADFLMTEENIHTAIVYGIVTDKNHDETLVGSFRTSKITLDPDAFIKEVFGKDAAGNYFGGGKLSAGGFQIPIGFLSGVRDEEYRQKKWQLFDAQIKQKIFSKIGLKNKAAE